MRPAVFLALCLAIAAADPVLLNAGGPTQPSIGWRGDSASFVSGTSFTYTTLDPIAVTGSWGSVYQSHRFAPIGDLRYRVPVPPGAAYTVTLLFAETWATAAGVREFTARINGADVIATAANGAAVRGRVDVFAMAGGRLRPLFVPVRGVSAVGGFITVDLVRVPGRDNPMLSGLVIQGAAADSLLGSDGFGLHVAPVTPLRAPVAPAAPSASPPALPAPVDVGPLPVVSAEPDPLPGASAEPGFLLATPEPGVVPAIGNPPAGAGMFTRAMLLTADGSSEFSTTLPASTAYGPDGRLYIGCLDSKIHALSVSGLRVTKVCTTSTLPKPPAPQFARGVHGLAFDPSTNDLRLYLTTATTFWETTRNFTSFEDGWQNGKVQAVTMAGPDGCFNDDLADVVTGLPVSNGNHAPSGIVFLPDGRMLIGVAGVTNAGNVGPELGGIAASPYSGAIISCPKTGAFIKYSNAQDPAKAKVVGGGCSVYAPGIRNTFSMTLHTNGRVYATDNGPSEGPSGMSTGCGNGTAPVGTYRDQLYRVEPGRCHGHPNKNRGECVFHDKQCAKALLTDLLPSTNGVIEYRSNWFGGSLKGDLMLTRFEPGTEGEVSRVQLDAAGAVAPAGFTQSFWGASSLSVAEGTRGELVMPRLFSGKVVVAAPAATPPPGGTFVVSVFPRRGPAAGGTRVTVHGSGFGTKPAAQFGAAWCRDVVVISAKAFSCVTPAGAKNSQVTVKVYEGSRAYVGETPDYWFF